MKKKICRAVVALTLAAFFASAKSQGIPVIDVAAIANMVQQYQQMLTQYKVLKDQLTQGTKTLESMTGSRGMAALFDNPQVRSMLPPEVNKLYSTIKGTPLYSSARAKLPTSNDPTINAVFDQTAATTAALQDFFNRSQMRMSQIQQLQAKIDSASDPAAKADLQNRIASEQNSITATNQLLAVMTQIAEQDAQAARQGAHRNFVCGEFKKCGTN